MLNTLNVNLNTDLKVSRVPELGVKIKSQDINNNLFILRFTDKGKVIELDETYTVEILTKFEKSKSHRLTSATVYRDYARWEFDTSFITQDEKVVNYVYVRKSGGLVVSADANAFAFDVGLSEIDKDAGRVAEVYDENYEKYLDEFKDVADFTVIQQAEADRESAETTRISNENERKSAEVIRLANEVDRVNAESIRSEFYDGFNGRLVNLETGRVELENLIANGDFTNGSSATSGTVTDGALTYTGTTQTSRYAFTGTPITEGNVYYLQFKVKADTLPQYAQVSFTGHGITFNYVPMIKVGEWATISGIEKLTRTTTNTRVYIYLQGTAQYDDFMLHNLTSIFGAGNEPTKSEMDELIKITGYFDEITLTQKQMLTWQLKLMRQNRNALIAIGGTII